MARKRHPDPLLAQAQGQASLQYDPQAGALRQLLTQNAQDYNRTRKVNASTAAGLSQASADAVPAVRNAFAQALSNVQSQQGPMGLGGDPQSAAFARRLQASSAGAQRDLVDRGLRATEGKAFANQQARSSYFDNKAKITGQIASLLGQKGTATAVGYSALQSDAAKAQQQAAQAQADYGLKAAGLAETVRKDQTMEGIAAAKVKAGTVGKMGRKWASPAAQNAAKNAIDQAMTIISQQRGLRDPKTNKLLYGRGSLIQLLTTGRAASTITMPGGAKVPRSAIPKLPADLVRAATNLVYDGTLSRHDVTTLHNAGIQVGKLGYKTRKSHPTAAPAASPLAPIAGIFGGR